MKPFVISVNKFIYYALIIVLFLVLVFGGFAQYVIGIPNTAYTLSIIIAIYVIIGIDIFFTKKISLTRISLICATYIALIFSSGILNNANILKMLLYNIFPLIPIGIFSLLKIFENRKISIRHFIVSFFRIVVIIQLPIILIQKYGFDFLIKLNNSNQHINEYDFMFGSFFIRADHALGFFLLMYLINVLFRYKRGELKRLPWIIISYITITIFLMESNLTKLILILVLGFYLLIWLYKKINFLGMFAMIFIGYILFNIAITVPAINGEYLSFKNKYTVKESVIAYNRGHYAKRPQVVIAYLNHIPIKWLGEGPYDYYNIFTGKFKKTKHFSQMIWTYHDMGLAGFIIIIYLAYAIVKNLSLNREENILLFGVLLFYLFMTNVYSDLSMMLSLIIISRKLN